MRCHPVYRKCTEICGPDQACSNPGVVCDNKKPTPNYPVATGHCLGSCKDSCEGQSKTWSYCFCDNVCMGMGDCCPDFNKACPTVQSSAPCSLWNWNGCAQGESCVPAGSDVGEVSCKTSGKGQPNGSCDKDDLATCSMSPFLGPQVCFEGKCATVCNVNAGVSMCPPNRTCTAIDADGVTMPSDYGVCL